MENLNAFIIDIITVDFSYFWTTMEVVESIQEERFQESETRWRIEQDWHTAVFKPFSETEAGLEYASLFDHYRIPKAPSVPSVQFALTDLLCLPDVQKRAQIDRLDSIGRLWGNNGYTGVQSDYSRLYDTLNLIPGIGLSEFKNWLKDQNILTKNLPIGSNKIHLRERFYQSFDWFINEKISVIQRLISEVENTLPRNVKQHSPTGDTDDLEMTTGFEGYIKEPYRNELMPYLIKNYTNLKPRFYAYMIGALIRLDITPESIRHSNKLEVHKALVQSFEAAFPYQSWNAAINRLDDINSYEDKREVSSRYEHIKKLLKL